ncbi:MAG: histidinol-phosphatase HisJ family protein [Anaerotignaceae bacterium]
MFFADYHTHSNFSSDSSTPMEQNIQRAIELGLKEIAVTDHIDFDYPDLDYPFMFDYADYRKQIDYLREKYSNCIKILIGVEIGIQPHVYPLITNLVNTNYYDFIIGSTHCVDKFDLCTNEFFHGKTKHDAYLGYFNDVLGNIKNCPIFSVYGHIDFINRYGDFEDKTMDYEEFAFITDEILTALIEKGKGIEINTSGFRYGLGHTHPQLSLVKRYKQLGGEIITVGSDAHVSSDITRDFETAYKMLKSAGFNYITTFQNKKPSFVKINI